MHDFRPFPHPSDRFFPAGTGRLTAAAVNNHHNLIKPYPSAMAGPLHPPPQLKCPRCESLNTKFCYYNNYNLSQPRHFCKSCRRYWTRGGVLRNVPVGGGCRKPKRSSSKSTSSVDKDRRRQTSGSLSSGDTSTSVADPAVIPFNSSSSNPNPSFLADIPLFPPPPAEIFSSLRFNFGDPDLVDRTLDEELVYRTATDEPPPPGREEGGGVEWAPAMDPTIYEISGTGDPTAYWNHGHWTDGGDPSPLYLP